MSGEDEQSRQGTPNGGMKPVPKENPRPAAGSNPFLAEAPPAAAAPVVKRRGKPPPGIISAGGVDMARAHASNIRPAADTEMPPMETAKVVVSVETNPRRVQTMRNLEGMRPPLDSVASTDGTSPWAQAAAAEAVDKNALPSANLARDRDTVIPPGRKRERQAAFWIRVATVMVALLLVAGVARRVHLWTQRNAVPPPPPHVGGPLIPPPLPEDSAEAAAPSASASSTAAGAHAGSPSPLETVDMDLDEKAEPTARVIRVKPRPPPPPPKPSFTPLFEIPEDRKKD